MVPYNFISKKVFEIVSEDFGVEVEDMLNLRNKSNKQGLARMFSLGILRQIAGIPERVGGPIFGYKQARTMHRSLDTFYQSLERNAELVKRYKALRGRCFEAVYGVSLKEAKSLASPGAKNAV